MRKRRAKKYVKSALDDVRGLGPQKQKLLIKKFGSVKRILEAPDDELVKIPGITEALIDQMRRTLSK
jgi:excinuclease ABC subunit C